MNKTAIQSTLDGCLGVSQLKSQSKYFEVCMRAAR